MQRLVPTVVEAASNSSKLLYVKDLVLKSSRSNFSRRALSSSALLHNPICSSHQFQVNSNK